MRKMGKVRDKMRKSSGISVSGSWGPFPKMESFYF